MGNSKYTIAPSGKYTYFQWINIFGILLVVVYLWLTYDIYQDEGWSSEAIINLLLAVIYAAIIYFNLTAASPYEEISFLSEEGVMVAGDKKQESEVIEWSELQKVSMTNNSLFLDFKDETQIEFNISYLKYNQLQKAKLKIQSFCEQQQLAFTSKY